MVLHKKVLHAEEIHITANLFDNDEVAYLYVGALHLHSPCKGKISVHQNRVRGCWGMLINSLPPTWRFWRKTGNISMTRMSQCCPVKTLQAHWSHSGSGSVKGADSLSFDSSRPQPWLQKPTGQSLVKAPKKTLELLGFFHTV